MMSTEPKFLLAILFAFSWKSFPQTWLLFCFFWTHDSET
jgi:hypothetical protein